MKRWLALGWLLAFLPLVASARQIPVKTVPVATGDQFLIFPSINMSMGGISIALDDPLYDPFVNPAKGINIQGVHFTSAPTYYGISMRDNFLDDASSARTLPVGMLMRQGALFGGAVMAWQELSKETTNFCCFALDDVAINTAPIRREQSSTSRNNIYAFALAGAQLPGTNLSVGASVFVAGLNGLEGVRLLYADGDRILYYRRSLTRVCCEDAVTKRRLWEVPITRRGPFAMGGGRAVVWDGQTTILCLEANEGKKVWKGTSDAYQQGASGDGPSDYLDDPIVDAPVWQANIQYVIDVTTERTDDQAIHAFLDDVRSKNYSVIDGYGPLTEAYVAHSGAYGDVPVPTVDQVLQDVNFGSGNNDGIAWAGSKTSELGAVVTLVDAFRQRAPASTNASKYIFSTPRPWRMTDTGAIDFLGTANHNCYDVDGNLTVQLTDQYTTSVKLVPGLTCAQRPHKSSDHDKGLYSENTENRRKDGGYPSGHTNAGYLAAMAYAYALPQRYAEMLTRGSQLGENRIVAGMHSPVDVIGGRIHAMMVAAHALAQPDILADATAAYDSAQGFFGQLAAEQDLSLYELAH
ncbi:MAG: phosphatase PAP2 family protein, partial [Bacteroidetes bacterium]|nr:phosphatase PAP2 family protein [Bacteroidota bacterium]